MRRIELSAGIQSNVSGQQNSNPPPFSFGRHPVRFMLRRMALSALVAGCLAGVAVSLVQMAHVMPLIEEAEVIESAQLEKNQAAETAIAAPGARPVEAGGMEAMPVEVLPVEAMLVEDWAPSDGIQRTAFTVLANILTGIGFGFLLVAAFAVRGRPMDAGRGLAWGLAGFVVFALAPALGLPPEPPGMTAAPLVERQGWWLMAVAGTGAGLALLVFARRNAVKALGLVLIVLPHALGAPHFADGVTASLAPTAFLATEFAFASLVATFVFWCVLGGMSGLVYRRLA